MKAVVTDYNFDTLEIEESILKPLGIELVGLKPGKDQQTLINLVKDADFVIAQFAPVNADVIGAMEKAKIIVRYGIGVDNVDLKAAAAKNIPVCNVPDYCIDEVADHALAFALDMTRKITANANKVKAGGWGLAGTLQDLFCLKNMTVGVVGFGRIGREVAARLKAFKCKVQVFDPVVDAATVRSLGCSPVSLDELFRTSDLITLHCPSNDKTKYMINAQSIATMKRGVLLVNSSRGTLVKTDDLTAALKSGQISAAALDVTDPEPPAVDSPLRKMDNCVINSHIASASPQAAKKLRTDVANLVVRAFRGEKLVNIVNGVKG
jgi:D-3-phosphoglycerate dehydrogenase / 2-oxoglutarate reductase